jgi:N-acetylmuramoyl-L-alanine amidase
MTPKGIVVHHSATTASTWDQLRDSHLALGYLDIGYHIGVEKVDGKVYIRTGRPITMRGAHEPRANGDHIGVVVVGNFSLHELDPDLQTALEWILISLMAGYDLPLERVTRHLDWKATECPGTKFPWMKIKLNLKHMLEAGWTKKIKT